MAIERIREACGSVHACRWLGCQALAACLAEQRDAPFEWAAQWLHAIAPSNSRERRSESVDVGHPN